MAGIYICGRCFAPGDERFSVGTTQREGICTRCGGLACWVIDEAVDEPFLAVQGRSAVFTTSMTIERFPTVVWDVNGYYRALGVSHYASKLDIRRAYQMLNGHENERLTYIVKQLLNDEVRCAYDAVDFGSVFFDRYIQASVRREMEDKAAQAIMDGSADFDDMAPIDLSESLNKPFEVDKHPWRAQDGRSWGYYRWRSQTHDDERLGQWRGLLAEAVTARGEKHTLAVGFLGRQESPWAVLPVGDRVVVFLHENANPTPSLAEAAAERLGHKVRPYQEQQHEQVPQGR